MRDPVGTDGQQSWEPEPLHIPLYTPNGPRGDRDPSLRSPAPGSADEREPGTTVIVIDLF